MYEWLLFVFAIVAVIGWSAWVVHCAPLGVEDENGFHVIESGCPRPDWHLGKCRGAEHPFVGLAELPLWPG